MWSSVWSWRAARIRFFQTAERKTVGSRVAPRACHTPRAPHVAARPRDPTRSTLAPMSAFTASAVAAPAAARAVSARRAVASRVASAPKRVVARAGRSPASVRAKAGPSGEVKKVRSPRPPSTATRAPFGVEASARDAREDFSSARPRRSVRRRDRACTLFYLRSRPSRRKP